MTTKQPQWKQVAQLGDANPIEYGGYFVYEDETGVYPPEAVWLVAPEDDNGARWIEYRFILEPCTFINGILSDNKYHPEHAAWLAGDLEQVASFTGETIEDLIGALTGDDVFERALAWRAIGEYHGLDNLDSYPNRFTRSEIEARYPRETWKI